MYCGREARGAQRLELLSVDHGNRRSLEARAALGGAPSLEPEVTLTTLPLPRCIAVERRARSLKARAALRGPWGLGGHRARSLESRAARARRLSLELLLLHVVHLHIPCFLLGTPLFLFIPCSLKVTPLSLPERAESRSSSCYRDTRRFALFAAPLSWR